MTPTATKADISLVNATTHEDAVLLLQLAQLSYDEGWSRGSTILWGRESPITDAEFRSLYSPSSQGYADVMKVMSWYETIGTLVKNGLLNRDLVHDWLWIEGAWQRCEAIALRQRDETDPKMWENFELLAKATPTI
jgi:hypothetical protein